MFLAAKGVYEREKGRLGHGEGRATTLGRTSIGPNLIHNSSGQYMVTHHPHRFVCLIILTFSVYSERIWM
jgi:hypothetical protein